MKTVKTPGASDNVFEKALSFTFNKLFSKRVKRLVFISSIVGLVYKSKEPDLTLISKLNSVLHIANSAQAMQLPYRVKSVIWKDADLTTLSHSGKSLCLADIETFDIDKEDIERLTVQVVSQTPWWLKYSSPEVMCEDLKVLFKQIQKPQNPHFA